MASTVGLHKNLYWFLNLEDKPLMRCRHCNFPRGKGETILEKWYLQNIYKIPSRPPLFHIGLLAELLISIGPHSPAHFVLREPPSML